MTTCIYTGLAQVCCSCPPCVEAQIAKYCPQILPSPEPPALTPTPPASAAQSFREAA